MKLKMTAVITNPVKFAAGDKEYSVSLFNEPQTINGWHNLNEVEIEIPDDLVPDMHKQAIEILDEQEAAARANFEAAMEVISKQRERLLALPHMGENE